MNEPLMQKDELQVQKHEYAPAIKNHKSASQVADENTADAGTKVEKPINEPPEESKGDENDHQPSRFG